MALEIRIKKMSPDAKVPDQPYEGDAGFDLYAAEEVTLEPHERNVVKTGIAVAIPEGYVGLIWDKAGISIKQGQRTLGGVIDSGYRGEVIVGMINLSEHPFTFKVGDPVAQMLVQEVEQMTLKEVDRLDDTERGERGLGG